MALTGLAASDVVAHSDDTPKKPATVKQQPTKPPSRKQPPLSLPRPSVKPDPNRPQRLNPNEFLSTAQLRPGMQGYGLTVLQGNTIEKFDVKILGVVKKANNGRDLILVKLGGAKLSRVTDVIAGMSGSPVYIGGKIVGAVAYGAAFTRESIGYLTPIEDMLEAWDPLLPQSPDEPRPVPSPVPLPQPVTVGGKTYSAVQIADVRRTLPRPGVLTLRPLGTKVTVSGVSGPRFAKVAAELGQWGLEARQGGGVVATGLKGSPLTPGGAIAMSLATGDIDITGIGTLTYRRGQRVVAFGHPFLGVGPIEAPMYTAYIHDIEPSFAESHKVGSPVSLVGTFGQDRPFSIGGSIGPRPKMIPLTVRVNDRMMNRARTFQANLIRHPMLLSTLTNIAAGTAITEIHGQPGDAMATVTTEVVTEGYGTISRTNRVYDAMTIDEAALSDLRSLMSLLTSNSFQKVGVRSVKLDVQIEPGRATATVERIFLKQGRFEPGETVEVGVVLKPYKQEPILRTVSIPIPANVPTGPLTVTVQGGPTGLSSQNSLFAALMGRGPDYSAATNITQLLQKYNERERNDALVVRLSLPSASLSVNGEKFSDLPPHIEAAMRIGASRSSGTRQERDEVKITVPTEFVLSGMQTLPVRVIKPSQSDNLLTLPGTSNLLTLPGTSFPASDNLNNAPPATAPTPPNETTPPNPNFEEQDTDTATFSVETEAPFAMAPPDPEPVKIPAKPPTTAKSTDETAEGRSVRPVASTTAPAGKDTKESKEPRFVGRQPGVWRQATVTDFRPGTFHGTALTASGIVRLAPRLAKLTESQEPYFWSLVSDGNNGVFAGSGDAGVIYHIAENGTRRVFCRTGESEVYALTRGTDGSLYAGTAPEGRIYKITPEGKTTLLFDAPEKYVLALSWSSSGTLLAAVGGPKAKIYELNQDGSAPITRYASEETNVTALTVTKDGTIYAGTAPNGLILRLSPGKRAEMIYDATESGISGLVVDDNRTVFATTAPKGTLIQLSPNVAPRVLYERSLTQDISAVNTLSGLLLASDGTLYTASGSTLITLEKTGNGYTAQTFDAPTDVQILGLHSGDSGTIYAATGNVASVYTLAATKEQQERPVQSGEFVSSVFDTKAVSQWGTVRWSADLPAGTSLGVQTRSGNTATPDGSWSDWSSPYGIPTGERIQSPSGRYLQYRILLSGTATASPQLRRLEVFYLPPNAGPQVTLISPRGGEFWRGTKTVRWSAADPDKDTLAYEVALSGDNGKTWQTLQSASAVPKPPEAEKASATTDDAARMLQALEAELAKHPEMSAQLRAKILSDAPAQFQSVTTTQATRSPATNTPSVRDNLALDTARFADGTYLLRVTASDRLSNPTDSLSAEVVSTPFQIVNRPPLLTLLNTENAVQPGRIVRWEGVALQLKAAIRAVQFRVDEGEWTAATAKDGIFDSLTESFTLTTPTLAPGSHTVEVQAIDEAGNSITRKLPVTVP